MYIGKDKEGRYNCTDNSRFIFSKEFIEKGENTLRISVDENFTRETYKISESTMKSWGVIKEGTENHDSTVYFMFKEGVQNQLYALNYNDPVTMLLDLKIYLFGKLELRKLNTNGKITIDKLKKGTYIITEKSAPNGYLLDTKAYNVEVKVNQTATKAIVN